MRRIINVGGVMVLVLCVVVLMKSSVIQVPSGTWAPAGELSEARSGASAALLSDGRVLVSGGEGNSGPLSSAEFFTSGGAFVSAAPMNVARSQHISVVLKDGRVLVAGGRTSGSGMTNASEVFDPFANSWSVVGSMIEGRAGHTASLLQDGRVLITGGDTLAGASSTLEVFDPATSSFAFAGTMSSPRKNHAAAVLSDGRVLIAGGSDGSAALASMEIYDPVTGSISAAPGLSMPRAGLSATTLLDGKVLLAGGNNGSNDLASAEVYDPEAGTVTALASAMAAPRSRHQAFLLPYNNSVLIAGGASNGSEISTAELFIPWGGIFTQTGSLSAARIGASGNPLGVDGLLHLAGGENASGKLASSELYGFATVKTDKDDYAPGEMVTITGKGWQPGETVSLLLHEVNNPDPHEDLTLTAVADAYGKIFNTEFAPESHDVGVRFCLTASGSASQAQTTFTDSVTSVTITSPTSGSPITITSLPANVTISFSYVTSSTGATKGTADILGTTISNSKSLTPGTGSDSIVLTIPAGTANGSYNVKVTVTNSTGTGSNNKNDNQNGAVVVNVPTNSSPTITANNGSIAVNEGQTAANTGTWSDANAGDTVTLSASVGTIIKSGTNAGGTWSWSFGTTDGPAESQTVNITANDGNGGITTTTFTLTVSNVAPTAAFNAPASVNEGSAISLSLTSPSDPSSVDTAAGFQFAFDCGDGSGYGAFSATSTASCTTADNGSRNVKGKIKDKDGSVNEYSATVTINNVAPTGTFNSPASVNEGSAISLSLTGVTDPSTADTTAGFAYAFDCGDGSGYGSYGSVNITSCSTSDSGSRIVKGKVKDKDGGESEYTATVTIENVAPTATLSNNGPVNEGSAAAISFSNQSDPSSADTTAGFHYAFSCDGASLAGATYASSGTSAATNCTFPDGPATPAVYARIIDKDGGYTEYTTAVTVKNQPPSLTAAQNQDSDEGTPKLFNLGTFNDPGTNDSPWAIAVNWGDSPSDESFTVSTQDPLSRNHSYGDNGNYTVTVKVTDKDRDSDTKTFQITVKNLPPTVNTPTVAPEPSDEGGSVTVSATFSDPGSNDGPFSCTVNFGDGTSLAGTVSGNTCNAPAHTYADNGNYTITVEVTDKDGGKGSNSTTHVVNNVAPTGTLSNNGPVNEGSAATISFSNQFDPSSADVTAGFHYAFSCDGSSLSGATYATSGSSSTANCTLPDGPKTVTVRARIIDKDGGSKEYITEVTVNNVAPALSLILDQTANEGTMTSFNLGTFTDPGADNPWKIEVNWGDGSIQPYDASAPGALSQSHSYGDDGSYNVIVTVTDKDKASDSKSFHITVKNLPPVVNTPLVSAEPSNEGDSVVASANFSDPGVKDAPFTCTVNYGDGSSSPGSVAGNTCTAPAHFYVNNGSFTITFSITDKDGGIGSNLVAHTVNNVLPTLTSENLYPASVQENGSISLEGVFFDPGMLDGHVVAINWGDGTSDLIPLAPKVLVFAARHQYLDDDPTDTQSDQYLISITVTDDVGPSAPYTGNITVTNLPPVISGVNGPSLPLVLGTSATVTVNFTDAGTKDTHSCKISWDDLTPDSEMSASGTGSGSCTFTHTYAATGVYGLNVTVTDDDTGTVTSKYEYIVVYDPNGGFVTGGGWINSPAGAYRADTSLTGKANFGFVSKYQKGATVPTGETEFQFHVANFNFHSSSYDWLVISGAKAQYKGTGTVNGTGKYGFLLTATDGQINGGGGVDRFRIKIWDMNNGGAIVYDNVPGASDDIDAANPIAISGGSIVVHK